MLDEAAINDIIEYHGGIEALLGNRSDVTMKKFTDSWDASEWDVMTDSGWKPVNTLYETIPYDKWILTLENGLTLECADKHIVFREDGSEVWVEELTHGDLVLTEDGPIAVESVVNTKTPVAMYDLEVNSEDHRFYTNGILSHNTTTAAALILHYIIFNEDKTVAILANKGDAAREVLDRIKTSYEELPKWLQHGILVWNKGDIKLENGCKVIAASSSSSAIRGKSCVTGDTEVVLSDGNIVLKQQVDRSLIQDEGVSVQIVTYEHIPTAQIRTAIVASSTAENFICDSNLYDGKPENWRTLETKILSDTPGSVINLNQVWTRDGFKEFDGIISNGQQSLMEIALSNGRKLRVTPDHRFMSDGVWYDAQSLNVGFTFFVPGKSVVWIESIKNLDYEEEVFDLVNVKDTVSYDTHGVESHNCAMVYIDECVVGDTMITLRDKFTGRVFDMKIEQAYDGLMNS